jgi:hypothetical protein
VNLRKIVATSIGVLALGSGGLAHAATTYNWTWSTTLSGNPPADNTSWTPSTTTGDWCAGMTSASMSTYGNCARWGGSETPATSLTNVLQVKAYSNTGAGSSQSTYDLETAYLAFWGSSGVGVVNRNTGGVDPPEGGTGGPTPSSTSPEHSFDNNDRYDMVLLTFDRAVSLTGVDIGWSTNDSDITVMALTGSYSELAGKDYGSLAGLGWTLVGHYPNADSTSVQAISTALESRYWLVGARNAAVGGATGDSYKDYVKIAGFTARETIPDNKVPEPSAAMLIVAAMGAGGWAARRRRATQETAKS